MSLLTATGSNGTYEKLLDLTAIVKMKIQKIYGDVLQDTCKLGTGIMKITQYCKKEWFTDRIRFKAVETESEEEFVSIVNDNLSQFNELFGEKGRKNYPKILNKIKYGKAVSFRHTYEDYSYNDPKAERVRPQEFIFSKGRKDLEECRLVGQLFSKYWTELKEREKTDGWENIESLKMTQTGENG